MSNAQRTQTPDVILHGNVIRSRPSIEETKAGEQIRSQKWSSSNRISSLSNIDANLSDAIPMRVARVSVVDVDNRELPGERAAVAKALGTIVRDLDNGLVLCSVTMNDQDVEITLPADCFDFQLAYGTPFFLQMAERGGYTVPVVERRAPPPLSDSDRAIFDAALSAFSTD